MRATNHLIGTVNFLTFVLSIPILSGGIWLSSRGSSRDCLTFLQWPLIAIGAAIMVISLAGIVGSCYRNTLLMRLYLFLLFFVILVLLGFVIFGFVATEKGSGRAVAYRAYKDYYLEDYSGWMQRRAEQYWGGISSCVRDSKVCAKMGILYNGVPEPPQLFYTRKLTSLQSGCCKPPTECGYTYVNETVWVSTGGGVYNSDCNTWSNDQSAVCYSCRSCKAGVLAGVKNSWRRVSVINIVVLILLLVFYVVAYAAFKNNQKIDNNEPSGEAGITKLQPSRFQF